MRTRAVNSLLPLVETFLLTEGFASALFQDETYKLVFAFCFVFMVTRVAAKTKSGSWVESLVRTFLTVFGGGTLVPLILGSPPVFLNNDVLFFLTLVAWILTHLTPVGRWVEYNKALRVPVT